MGMEAVAEFSAAEAVVDVTSARVSNVAETSAVSRRTGS